MWVKDFATRAYVSKGELTPTNLSDDFRLWWNDVGKNQPIGTWQKLNKDSPYTHYSDLLIDIFAIVYRNPYGWVSIDQVAEKSGLKYEYAENYLYQLVEMGFLDWESKRLQIGQIVSHMPLTVDDTNDVVKSKHYRVFSVKNIFDPTSKLKELEIEYM